MRAAVRSMYVELASHARLRAGAAISDDAAAGGAAVMLGVMAFLLAVLGLFGIRCAKTIRIRGSPRPPRSARKRLGSLDGLASP